MMRERPGAPTPVDLAVIGGGPGGSAAAVTAAREGMSVALLTSASRTARAGESLPPGGGVLLEEILGPNAFDPGSHLPAYGTRSVWGSEHLDESDSVFNPFGSGWHLDRPAFDERLLESAAGSGVRVTQDCRVLGASMTADGWDITADICGADRRIHARWLIDATGRTARIARSLGVRRRRLDRLVAAVWVLGRPAREDADRTITVEATRTGWWYTAPVPQDRRLIAFVTDPALFPPRFGGTHEGGLLDASPPRAITEPLRAAGYRTRTAPVVTDAASGRLDDACGERWWAVGDAAVCFDPLSSQGIVSALLTGREAGLAAAGRTSPAAYADLCASLLADHVRLREAYYASEDRWLDSPFWSRRRRSSAPHRSPGQAAGAPNSIRFPA